MRRRRFIEAAGLGALASTAGCMGYNVVERERVENRKEEIRNLEEEVEEQQAQSDSLQETVQAQRQQMTAQQRTVEDQQREIDRQERTIDAQRETIDAQQRTIDRMQQKSGYRPEALFVNLVSDWNEYGDASDNAISSTAQGGDIKVAMRWDPEPTNDRLQALAIFDIYTIGGRHVARDSYRTIASGSIGDLWETYVAFDTSGWATGDYEVVGRVADELAHAVSEPTSNTFELY